MTDIYTTLRSNLLWQKQAPTAEALASDQPFCVDTLSFEQWLQYVFLPRMGQLVSERMELPAECAVAPMAEQAFVGAGVACAGVVASLARVDLLITDQILEKNLI